MDASALESTLAALTPAQRRRIIAFLFSLDADDAHRQMLSRKIEDKDPAHWVKGEDLNKALGLDGPTK